jgi:hypothetical protein
LVHGSKDSAAEGALLSPWCSEYCLTGEGLKQGHLGTAEEILGSIGKRCGPLWDHRAEHGKTGQSNCWERGTKNTLYISDVYYIHAQHGSIVKEVDGFGLSFRIILENSSRSSAISAICTHLIYLLVYRFVYRQMRAEDSSRRRWKKKGKATRIPTDPDVGGEEISNAKSYSNQRKTHMIIMLTLDTVSAVQRTMHRLS